MPYIATQDTVLGSVEEQTYIFQMDVIKIQTAI